jgi:hypothetical protein
VKNLKGRWSGKGGGDSEDVQLCCIILEVSPISHCTACVVFMYG